MKIEKKRRVVITGNTVKAGRCAVGPITAFDTNGF